MILFFEFVDDRLELLDLVCEFLVVQKIAFVPQQNFRDLVSAMKDQLLQPHFRVVQGLFIGDVEYHASCFGKVEIIINDCSESLLSCGVPQLKSECGILIRNVFELVVHANGGLLGYILAIDVSKEKGTFADGRFADNDRFKRFDIETVQMTHVVV